MNETNSLTSQDLVQLGNIGIPPAEVQRQFDLFRRPPPPVQLLRPCVLGDGIIRLTDTDQTRLVERWRSLAGQRQLAKFVPASGAATRMFKDLTAPGTAAEPQELSGPERLLEALPRFAFFAALKETIEQGGADLGGLVERHQIEPLVTALLGAAGLGYGAAPKGQILFHDYPDGPRTAFEEQLWEGLEYLAAGDGTAGFHFTVSVEHEAAFRALAERLRQTIEDHSNVALQISFSTQSPSTDTVAVDVQNRPIRHPDGQLLLRPAGHGALLSNLQSVDADIVFVKNIDNIAHQRLQPISILWKRVLAGYFAELQEHIFDMLGALDHHSESDATLDRGMDLLQDRLAVQVPPEIHDSDPAARRQYLRDRLDRPLRVCGMVKNEGEPGGGPFWLPTADGGAAGQIVESAQIDADAPEQVELWRSSTHFNPVDLVCGLRDREGNPYRLADFVDPDTSFVAEKSHGDQAIKALERPGLWNGSMAGWNTAFVEVPLETFTPVKTVFDLLRREHQP